MAIITTGAHSVIGFCLSHTRFGNRQNSRTHLVLGWRWPFLRLIRVPQIARLRRNETLFTRLKFGRIAGLHETGDPIWL